MRGGLESDMNILLLNSGSSSLKATLMDASAGSDGAIVVTEALLRRLPRWSYWWQASLSESSCRRAASRANGTARMWKPRARKRRRSFLSAYSRSRTLAKPAANRLLLTRFWIELPNGSKRG